MKKNLKIQFKIFSSIILITIFSGLALILTNFVSADMSESKTATVHVVNASCTLSSTTSSEHSATVTSGQSQSNIGTTTFTATCNDPNGYALYMIGNSGDVEGNTSLIASSPLDSSSNIATGASGDDSYWAVMVSVGSDGASVLNNYDSYNVIPSTYTKVAAKTSGVSTGNVAVSTTYKVSLSKSQPSGGYSGKVKYVLVNPSTAQPTEED